MQAADLPKPRRIELILREIDSLPTLPTVATRLLQLTSDQDTQAAEVVELVSSDPALTAKVLSLCRTADRGVRAEALTVERAVVLLGFNAIRNAVLSIKVFETFGEKGQGTRDEGRGVEDARRDSAAKSRSDHSSLALSPPSLSADPFDRVAFWRHSLGVAIAAELIAKAHGRPSELNPDEAFVCGLLHDIGKLALDHVLPKAFARVITLAQLNHANIAQIERRVLGIDHHTAGKRLAEQWGLPHTIQDCIWLHGSPFETLPRLDHRRLIGLVTLADHVARVQHVGYSGNFVQHPDTRALADDIGVEIRCVDAAVERLHDELERRGQAMGLHDQPSRELFLQSIQRANAQLGTLNAALERRSHVAASQGRILDQIIAFHAQAAPASHVQGVLDRVVASAVSVLGPGFYALLMPHDHLDDDHADTTDGWYIGQYSPDGQVRNTQTFTPPPHTPALDAIDARDPNSLNVMSILPWIADYLLDADDLRKIRLLPLSSGWGTAAVLLHDRDTLPPWSHLQALTGTWGAAIAAASQHDGARRLGEELADANRALADAQHRLLQSQSMARLGEMAAGAAHEMNNPLAIISGRSQLLTMALPVATKEHDAAKTIFEQAHRLSDLITALRLIADPPQAERRPVDLHSVIDEAIKKAQAQFGKPDRLKPVTFKVKDHLPPVNIDPAMVAGAVTELVSNALAASPRHMVQIVAHHDEQAQRLMIQVTDDGVGMDEHTLHHAVDPFFSAKPAGRRMGMGLPRAKQWVAAHGGDLALRSTPDVGTVATLCVPLVPPNVDESTPPAPETPEPGVRQRGRRGSVGRSGRAVART